MYMSVGKEEEKAGYLLVEEVPVVSPYWTVGDVEELLVDNDFEDVDYIYVERSSDHFLVGVMSVKEVFKRGEDVLVKEFMSTDVVSVSPETDQEEVVRVALEHDLKSVPVVDHGSLLGVVPHHVLLDIMRDEGLEDSLVGAGVHTFDDPSHDIIHASVKTHVKKRLPWLVIGLVGGALAAFVVSGFEEVLGEFLILASFIPGVVYVAGAVGNQTQTIFIRSVALEDVSFWKYLWREVKVNLFLGLVLSLLFFFIVLGLWRDVFFGAVIGVSVFFTSLVAVLVGTCLPWFFQLLGMDPAVSSGPFATAVIDLLSLVLYFGIATIMIALFL